MQPPEGWIKTLDGLGLNRFAQPEWRIVWGPERMEWRGGNHADYDANGILLRRVAEMRLTPKYGKKPTWIIERWLPPELYGSPERWRTENLDPETGLLLLGPYPSQGEYECCFRFEDKDEVPFDPNEDMIQCLVKMVKETQGMSDKLKHSAMMEAHKRNEAAYKKKVRDLFQEAKEDVDLAIGRRPSRLLDVPYGVKSPLTTVPNTGLIQGGAIPQKVKVQVN
jgi:hypothetical protein